MGNNTSPGIKIKEKSFSKRVQASADTVFATLGMFSKGPVNERVRVSSVDEMIEIFGKPNNYNYMYFLPIASTLDQTSVEIVRVEDSTVKCASITFGLSGGDKTTVTTPIETLAYPLTYESVFLADEDNVTQIDLTGLSNTLTFAAIGPGPKYENIQVAVINKADYEYLKELQLSVAETTSTSELLAVGVSTYNNALSGDALSFNIAEDIIDINNDYSIDTSLLNAYLNFQNGPATDDEFAIYEFENNSLVSQYLVSTDYNKKDRYSKNMFANRVVELGSSNIRVLVSGSKLNASTITVNSFPRTSLAGADELSTSASTLEDELYFQLNENFGSKEEVHVTAFIDLDFPLSVKQRMDAISKTRADCIALLNVPADTMINLNTSQKNRFATRVIKDYVDNTLNIDSSYSAIYANYAKVKDIYNDEDRWIPITGHVANRMANAFKNNPWTAFAGLETGIIDGIDKLAYSPKEADIKILYPARVNPIVKFRGEGTMIYGNKTLQSIASSTDRIHVRNLLIYIETNVEVFSRSILFKANNEFTRAEWRASVSPFINGILQKQGIEEYEVVCDSSNNPPEVIANSELQAYIIIRPTTKAEFVTITVADVAGNLTISEVLSGINS